MKSAKQTLTVKLEKHPSMDAAWIKVPFDAEQVFGARRVPVKARVNGLEYRGTIVRMGGEYVLGIPKVFREAATVELGENIVVTLEMDIAERTVTPPADLALALKADKQLNEAWEKLSLTIKKENARALETAKRPETRARRLGKTLAMLGKRAAK
jgi:hypothetical protein